ncbi:MAG: sulfite exporter TauE/SafE family protein [Cyanobacteria bacterium REEB67]|nr:sulfite exporter TauE/SafE family protein [Cyanobacteria bacterium REEB67]
MTIAFFSLLIFVVCLAAGCIGALSGLGGGVIIVPVLVLAFGCDIHYAAGASLVSVVATSSGAAAAYLRDGYSNLRIAMFLEIATTSGAIFGSYLAGRLDSRTISIIFGLILIYSAITAYYKKDSRHPAPVGDKLAEKLKLSGTYPEAGEMIAYAPRRVISGFVVMLFAGTLSGLLGIGSGAMKVLALDQIMALPLKVSTTTSNLMIGVTASASSGMYFKHGYIDPALAGPVVLGVVAGSMLGARLLPTIKTAVLRKGFAIVLLVVSLEMIGKGLGGRF